MTTQEEQNELLIRIDENVKSILERLKNLENTVSILKTNDATNTEKIKTNESEIEKLRGENRLINTLNAIGVILAGILGIAVK